MNELQNVTDIDEVIKYAEREAEGCHQIASAYHTDEGVYLQEETCFHYKAILWENIHEWLEELKELRKKQRPHGTCKTCKHYNPYREQFSYRNRGDGYCKSTITNADGQAYINCHDEWYCANYEKAGEKE